MSIAPYPKRRPAVSRHDPSRVVGRMTLDEYVAFERDSLEKHEFLDGEVVRMAGGSPEHNLISANTLRSFGNALESVGANCDVYGSDQKLYISPKLAYYPDITVVCGEAHFDERDMLRNPAVVVEVLSSSTAAFDRGEKFEKYQTLPSLQHYILIEQDRISVTHFEKIAGNLWAIVGTHTALTENLTLNLGEIAFQTDLSAIYRRIIFEPSVEDDAKE
ncbi:MAG: Uma2 family endonuclease [Armatimonadota bacterium]